MKKFNFLIAFAISIIGFSQTILNQSEASSRTVQDPQTVIMLPGFHATSATANPFIARIGDGTGNGSPTDSGAGNNNPSGTIGTNNFHDTQGNIEVNGGGQLQYTLPIALPPSVKSVAPQINLVYTSASGNGIAGYGWSLSGITSISRMGKTIDKDGELKGIQLDYSDYYSFNGQRLIYKSGGRGPDYIGADGSNYLTEKYSNVKIKAIGTITGQVWQGPEYWEVTFEDGSQAWYGATTSGISNARTPIEYNIVKWKDVQGNYITYNYTQTNNVAVISSIHWGGNETLNKPHFNQIYFNYITRDLKEQSYIKGLEFLQEKLLNNVVVNANGSQFKKYQFNYSKDYVNKDQNKAISYQFLNSIQELNSQNQAANPIVFSTKTPVTTTNESPFGDFEDVITTGDYNGDGLVDFIVRQKAQNGKPEGYYLYFDAVNTSNPSFVYLGESSKYSYPNQLITFNIKPKDGYVRPKQGLLIINTLIGNPTTNSNIDLKYYSINSDNSVLNTNNNPLILENSKTISASNYVFKDYQYPPFSPPANYGISNLSQLANSKEIDIDSDGMSELIFAIKDTRCFRSQITFQWSCNEIGYRYFVIDNADIANNTLHSLGTPTSKNILSKSSIMDFDNDGKQDVMYIEDTKNKANVTFFVKQYTGTINQETVSTPVNRVNQYEIRKSGLEYSINYKNAFLVKGLTDKIMFGDLNGDKNIEILAPLNRQTSRDRNNTGWSINLNNGLTLSEFCQGISSFYLNENPTYTYQDYSYPGLIDIDGDGKSELMDFYVGYNLQGSGYSNSMLSKYTEFKYDPNNNQFKWSFNNHQIFSNLKGGNSIYPLYGDFRINNTNSKILFVSKSLSDITNRKIVSFNHYQINISKNISKIQQGSIKTDIEYKELDPTINPNFYAPVKKEQYPYMELDKLSGSYVVSRLTQNAEGLGENLNRYQDFRYRGMITHLLGKGIIGFRQTARSSWYANGYENTKIWSGAEIDPLNEGLPIKEWSIKTNDENSIFPADISLNNTNLLSFKSTEYQIDNLANSIKAIIPKQSISKDFMKNIKVSSTIDYGEYYLPKQTVSTTNDGFAISTTTLEYIHNLSGIGKDYYIGRPKSKTETIQAYGDTKVAKEEFEYSGNLLTKKRTYNRNNSEYIEERYIYDGFGNIIEKTLQNPYNNDAVQASTSKSLYDEKGRFVIKKTDNLGLETNITYNDWGLVLSQTDPFNNTLTNTYDAWGKLLTTKNNLSGTTSYTYEKLSNGDTKITEYSPDNDQKITYTNKLGQNYKSSVKGFSSGSYVSSEVVFDVLGRKIKESEPYFEGSSPTKWNFTDYDDYSRPVKITLFTGKMTTSSYNGRTVTATETNATGRFKTQVFDAIGNVTSSTDKGGKIDFKYNAVGENIEAKYETNVVTTQYDQWGRKSEFNDPSNGIYKYEYNGYGQLIHTISPKGHKYYTYDKYGQLYNQREVSNDNSSTNKTINIEYNAKGLITKKHGTSNGKAYSFYVNYDAKGRVTSSGENSNDRYFFKKDITYDDKGRVTSYEKGMISSGVYTKSVIENVYSNWSGDLALLKDKNTGKVLSELTETNAKGQVLKAKLGAVNIENTYDQNNFLSNISHKSTINGNLFTVLQVGYSFDAKKNELNNRTTGGNFNILENFTYDDNNRLTNWTNPKTGQLSNNVYDAKGRITENDQVGKIKFDDATKVYRPTGATLNANGQQNYNNTLIQSITYNENNDPIFIDGQKGDVAFTYGLTPMRQQVTYGGNFTNNTEGKFTKYYSEDGSYEVIKNNLTGQEKHILYIGGSPYESNIVYLKEYNQSSGSYKYLHKDYLGSILSITDDTGYAIEQRHFDAWGNLTHFKMYGSSIDINLFKEKTFLDRGYTSHEHFTEVGIIHMNGRLYDPLLRRFLNADENIQDPHNTQNYNKYGYVMNNPLMYNDPSGEFFVMGWFIPFIAKVIMGAIIGAGIGTGIYLAQAAINGNFSWKGLGKSILMGAINGAVSGGLSQVFSAGGFWATVGNGALAGAGSGGVTSLINGTNFLEGLWKGAVIGGAISAVSYTINFLCNSKAEHLTEADLDLNGTEYSTPNPSSDPTVLNERIKALRKNYTSEQIKRYGVGEDKLDISSLNNPDGYIGKGDIAVTTPDFFSNTSTINYSAKAANNPYLLGKTMAHETAHSYANKLTRFTFFSGNRIKVEGLDHRLNTVEHIAIKKLENVYYNINLRGINMKNLNIIPINTINNAINGLSPVLQSHINSWTDILYEVFNRKVTYQGASW